MNQREADVAMIVRDPLWLVHRYDPDLDNLHFIRVPREVHRQVTFITDEYLPADAGRVVIQRSEAVAALPSPAPVHFIFHSAYCCSTLLARAFDVEGVSMGLKEPAVLNDLTGWRHRGGNPGRIQTVLNDSLRLLARPFAAGEALIVKPSNVFNGFAPAVLAMRPEANALLLHAPLRTYLGSIAKKGMWGRLWVRDLLVKQLREGLVDFGFAGEDYLGQTDLQVAAVGWLTQHALFTRLVTTFGEQRVRTIDSETLVAKPAAVMTRLATLFHLKMDAGTVAAVVEGPAFTRHSKFGGEFGAKDRTKESSAAANVHLEEIEKVAIWAETIAGQFGLALRLPSALLD